MRTKTNKVPLVGPRGREELLKRINELEAQVAQQDHLYIEVQSLEDIRDDATAKQKLLDAYKRGTLLDVVVVQNDDNVHEAAKVITFEQTKEDKHVFCAIFEQANDSILTIDLGVFE